MIDNFTTIDGVPAKYHTAHEWMFRQGVLQILMWYIYEYPSFDLAWRKERRRPARDAHFRPCSPESSYDLTVVKDTHSIDTIEVANPARVEAASVI